MLRRLFLLGLASGGAVSGARAAGITSIDDVLVGILPGVPDQFIDDRVYGEPKKATIDYPFYIERNGFSCEAVESFYARAVILDERHEWFFENDLISSNLLLGWKAMSHPSAIRKARFDLKEGDVDLVKKPGVPDFLDDMALLSIIPDRLAVRSEIRKLRRNQIVSLSGHLCDVTSPAGVRMPGHQTLDNGVQKWTAIIDQVNSGGGAV